VREAQARCGIISGRISRPAEVADLVVFLAGDRAANILMPRVRDAWRQLRTGWDAGRCAASLSTLGNHLSEAGDRASRYVGGLCVDSVAARHGGGREVVRRSHEMSTQSPTAIYDQLVAERGDVPAQVRDAAEEIRRDLEHDLEAFAKTGHGDAWFR
jgi:hypothetical protein